MTEEEIIWREEVIEYLGIINNKYNRTGIYHYQKFLYYRRYNVDLEEVYLRQIDQKLKRQNELQEENNELLRALLKSTQ